MSIQITLDAKKSVEQNAAVYYEKAKKQHKKLAGAILALGETKRKLAVREHEFQKLFIKKEVKKQKTPKEWYEKFRWFFSRDSLLVVGGRDASSNEIIIKRHTEPHDLIFHTDIAGSPFFVVKTNGAVPKKETMEDAATATASYSRAWRLGIQNIEVYSVKPEQVTKETRAGEYISKGSFMIYGKRSYFSVMPEIAVGIFEGRVIGGPPKAVKSRDPNAVIVVQGDEKPSDVAKKIQKKIGGSLDDIIFFLAAGKSMIKDK